MIYLHKILPLLVSPLAVAFAIIVYGAVKSKKVVVYCAVAALYALSMPIVANHIFSLIEGPAFRQAPASMPNADAIVVLSGMLKSIPSRDGVAYEWTDADRFFAGIELFKLGKSPTLIFTGGKLPWDNQSKSEGTILSRFAESFGVPASQLQVTAEVKNTEEEARAVRMLLSKSKPTVLLVTSAFHMTRAQPIFEAQGIKVTPYAVDFRVHIRDMTPMDFLPNSEALLLSSLAWRELIGRTFYALKAP